MNWEELYDMQAQLDNYIEKNHGLLGADLFQEKILALLVELGELANETRCFKFWSKKPRSERAVILEEYVDGIHFILSLGLEKGYRYTYSELERTRMSETEQFNAVFTACIAFQMQATEDNYIRLFKEYLQLGQLLDFQESDIQRAYDKKNEINYNRQNKGY
ncbi:dUTPase [Oceanobacillus piezotolerans]|uniref:dUTPase n=1 Tax=Oceanobacillus piezotolerans TaxID=2448030 RepID=A0A498DE99_9BACI|nr:dUTP diphosphatase [Oceanobacillus piezotolerans]RLL48522.1 dUTPase [Oceanobacillus piezotolerans]